MLRSKKTSSTCYQSALWTAPCGLRELLLPHSFRVYSSKMIVKDRVPYLPTGFVFVKSSREKQGNETEFLIKITAN